MKTTTNLSGFTVWPARMLRLMCVVGAATLAACGGGDQAGEAAVADSANAPAVSSKVSGTTRPPPTVDARRGGIVLSEKMDAPESEEGDEEGSASQ
jgi:hypothetical protein